MTRRELEHALEDRCVARVEGLGGQAPKLLIPGVRGFPDRTVMLPGARVFFAEFKRIKSGRISAQQGGWAATLTRLGFGHYFIDTDEQFDVALRKELGL